MQVPEVEPKIIFDEDVADEQRRVVERMDELIPGERTDIDFLYGYDSAEELLGKVTHLTEGDLPPQQVSLLRAIAGVFKEHADGDFGYDDATESAAHSEAERSEVGVRRMRRLRVYIGRRSMWLSENRPANQIAGQEAA